MKHMLFLLCCCTAILQAHASTSPTLFFTDLTSGPVGSIVTVYGANLAGAVQVNQVSATPVLSSSSKISFIVPDTTSGLIRVGASNELPFIIRAGKIHYVATNGSNSNAGSKTAPWATIPYAFNAAQCGDIIYVMNGVNQTGLDNYGASLAVEQQCSAALPLALVGYPGATVTIGSATGQEYGIRNPDINGDGFNGMVFANLTVRANNTAIKDVGNTDWRIVGSDFSCPDGGGQAACVQLDYASGVKFFGNTIHDTGAGGTKYYHSFYATTDSIHIEVGWNHIYNNQSCRGIQFYSTGGSPQYDLIVHDNIVSGQQCDGINFSTVDATQGPVEAYNNLVYHVGLGGANLNSPNEACIASLGYGAAGGQILVYGNTLADCGSAGGSTAGAITVQAGSPTVQLTGNLVLQNAGEPIYSPNTTLSLVAATHNKLLTAGTAGVVDSNYHLVANSPAIGQGIADAGILYDLAGLARPQSGTADAGAYLYTSAISSDGPTATLSGTSLSFGSAAMDTTTAAKSITLSNSGAAALTISAITLSGADPAQFLTSNNCGSSLAAGQSCSILAQFSPKAAGAFSAIIAFSTNASNPSGSIALSGTGTTAAAPAVSLTPGTLAFGNRTVNTVSAAQTVTVKNTGKALLTIGSIALTGTNPSSFKLTNGCGASLAAQASCTVQIQFAPTTTGSLGASLAVTDNASGSPQKVILSGTGTAASAVTVSVNPGSISFGSQAIGSTSNSQAVTVKNTSSTAAVSVTSAVLTGAGAASFKLHNRCRSSLSVGAACTIAVSFAPTTAGTQSATLTITDNATGSPKMVALQGAGASAPAVTTSAHVSANNLYFYNRSVGSKSNANTITVTNTGRGSFTVASLSVTGAQAKSFSASSNCVKIAPGATCAISVFFDPLIVGENDATLVIKSNAAGLPSQIPLVGHGD